MKLKFNLLLNADEILFNVIENTDQYFRPILNSYIRYARLEENKSIKNNKNILKMKFTYAISCIAALSAA